MNEKYLPLAMIIKNRQDNSIFNACSPLHLWGVDGELHYNRILFIYYVVAHPQFMKAWIMNIEHKTNNKEVCQIAKVEFSMSRHAVFSNGLSLKRIKACGTEANFFNI